jgi:alpha-D-ribose 1-methylphosphonate 5-triphosphate synthase subunit PhnG
MEADDKVLVECDLTALKTFVTQIEPNYDIKVLREPSICLTMVRAEDSVEHQEFYLGEALTTECEVAVNNTTGYGICLGDEPERAYCIAVLDAILQDKTLYSEDVKSFLMEQERLIQAQEQEEYDQIMRTKVDFKLMEEA